jgi:hypothetical protein
MRGNTKSAHCFLSDIYAGNSEHLWRRKGLDPGFILALVIDPKTPQTIYAGTVVGGVFKSTDEGLRVC